jgi:DNA repair protein RadC
METSNFKNKITLEACKDFKVVNIKESKEAYEYAKQFYFDDIAIYESCFIILLNKVLSTIGWVKISQGGISGTIIDVRIVAKYAIDALATNVILVHNHPSGKLQPSEADIQLTKKIRDGLSILEITLNDHIIMTDNGYYSLADERILF